LSSVLPSKASLEEFETSGKYLCFENFPVSKCSQVAFSLLFNFLPFVTIYFQYLINLIPFGCRQKDPPGFSCIRLKTMSQRGFAALVFLIVLCLVGMKEDARFWSLLVMIRIRFQPLD
jgi:DMSO/TMAO reductase YedYZ heme-binding membrane subunit